MDPILYHSKFEIKINDDPGIKLHIAKSLVPFIGFIVNFKKGQEEHFDFLFDIF